MSVTLTTLTVLAGTLIVDATLPAMLARTAGFAASAPALSTEPSEGTKEKEKTSSASLTGVTLGVGEVVSTIPTLTSPIALVLLESLLGAYSATWADARAVRQPTVDGAVALLSNAHLGKLLGAALFVIALMHALLSALPTRIPHCVRFLASAYDSHLVKPAANSML
jgi:hypothetical protein